MQAYVYGEKRAAAGRASRSSPIAAHTAIVSIDMHQGHLADTPDCPCPAPRAREIVAPIDAFHDQARALGVPIIHVKHRAAQGRRRRRQGHQVGVAAGLPAVSSAPSPTPTSTRSRARAGPSSVTRVEPDDLIVETKKRLSVFYPTDLDFLLRNMGVRTVVLNGGFTDCCVLNAAFDASNHNYRVVVLRDLVRGTNDGDGGRGAQDGLAPSRPGHGFRRPARRVGRRDAPAASPRSERPG